MIKHSPYFSRMSLLLDLLPITNENPDLVLKGGTAINLFFRDLPRLSVDIDLMVLPALDRLASLDFIDQSTHKFQNRIKQVMPQLETIISRRTDGKATTLTCIKQHDLVKIEINPVIRQGLGTPSFLTLQMAFFVLRSKIKDEFRPLLNASATLLDSSTANVTA